MIRCMSRGQNRYLYRLAVRWLNSRWKLHGSLSATTQNFDGVEMASNT